MIVGALGPEARAQAEALGFHVDVLSINYLIRE
jgi:hypothetical protein